MEPELQKTVSRDGTPIGYFKSGEGPPLLLVHGALGDHSRWDMLRPHLEPYASVYAMDRRGRGASGDNPNYSIEREHEDVAAVVDAIAARSGSAVDVYCSSYGGLCAFGGATLTANLRRLALYEAWPSVNPEVHAPPPELVEEIHAKLEANDREGSLEVAYRKLLGLSASEFDDIRRQPSWAARVAAAHTNPRELAMFQHVRFAAQQAAKIRVPTLLLIGENSPAWGPEAETVAAALPDARIAVLEGQGHVADLLAPELVAKALLRFLRDEEVAMS